MVVAKWMPKIEAKRQIRAQEERKKMTTKSNRAISCPTCPLGRILGNKHSTLANGILVTSLLGSLVLRFPVFCALCPIGVATRGMFHLKAWTSISGKMMPMILELSIVPVAAVLLSLRENRFFCRKICPVGATLNIAGSFSPLFKPKIQSEHCVMKECPKKCLDYHLDYCGACRVADNRSCERVCPQNINLIEEGSLARCTKCMECYINCDKDAIKIQAMGKSEAISEIKKFFKKSR
jgi:ferredoxin-type protein NapH